MTDEATAKSGIIYKSPFLKLGGTSPSPQEGSSHDKTLIIKVNVSWDHFLIGTTPLK